MIGTYPDKAPECFMCGLGWAVLFVPSAKELARHPDEPPYWKCGVCSNVWPLTPGEAKEHRELMERTRLLDEAKAAHKRQKSGERRAAKTAVAVRAYGQRKARE